MSLKRVYSKSIMNLTIFFFNLRFNSLVQIYPKQYSSTKLIKCDMIKTAQNQTCSRSIELMIQWFDKCSAIIYLN